MAVGSKLLIKAGFRRKLKNHPYAERLNCSGEALDKAFKDIELEVGSAQADEIFEAFADHDYLEDYRDQMRAAFMPRPLRRYNIIYESPNESSEALYFWCLHYMKHDLGFPIVHKITDAFAAGEHSSFYSAGAQRLGLAQDKVVQYLATIGKMIKELFQMVRELRWIDERLAIYRDTIEKRQVAAERTLKGLWVDLVDGVVGGQRSGANILTMAQQLQFSTLPDLFFNIHPATTEEIDEIVDTQAKGFNKQVRGTLKAKLRQYMQWRTATFDEMKVRRKFTVDYLAQHFNIIRMYMNWARPYLRRIQSLTLKENYMNDPSIISAFETSKAEVELLGIMQPKVGSISRNTYYIINSMHFVFQSRPQMSFSKDGGYHRGPQHQGTTEITWRCYAWTRSQIDAFIKMKDDEDLELFKVVDRSLGDAMQILGKDLRHYLEQVKQKYPWEQEEKKSVPKKQPGLFEPFELVFKGFLEPFASLWKGIAGAYHLFIPEKKSSSKLAGEKEAQGKAMVHQYNHYKNFKKSHRMLSF